MLATPVLLPRQLPGSYWRPRQQANLYNGATIENPFFLFDKMQPTTNNNLQVMLQDSSAVVMDYYVCNLFFAKENVPSSILSLLNPFPKIGKSCRHHLQNAS